MNKKPTKRKCCGCQEIKDRDEMIRITAEHDTGKITVNPDSKTFGRSVYLCPEKTCFERAFKRSSVTKLLKNKHEFPACLKQELSGLCLK